MKNLTAILKRIGNVKTRPLLFQKVAVINNDALVTDLETFIILKNVNKTNGIYHAETFDKVNNPIENLSWGDYPKRPILSDNQEKFETTILELEKMLPYTSKDETRLMLNAIYIDTSNIVAVDGYRLIKREHGQQIENNYLMPRTSIKHLIDICKKFKIKKEEIITINLDENFFQVKNENFEFYGRLVYREFPKYEAVIPKSFLHKIDLHNMPDFKEIKGLLNKKNNAIALIIDKDRKIHLEINTNTKEVVNYDCVGSVISEDELRFNRIGFNAKYLYDAMEKNENTFLKLNNELSPTQLNHGDFLKIVMPFKV